MAKNNVKNTETSAGGAVRGPSAAMLALFSRPTAESVLTSMTRKNMPRMVKAVDADGENIPVGGTVSGIIVDVIRSPKFTIKGSLLWLALVEFDAKGSPVSAGVEITFPATGAIRQALAPNVEKVKGETNHDAAREEMLKFRGHLFIAKRQADGHSKEFKKDMTMWDVYLSPAPVDIGVKIH